jgi:hypothetical protein
MRHGYAPRRRLGSSSTSTRPGGDEGIQVAGGDADVAAGLHVGDAALGATLTAPSASVKPGLSP